MNSPKKIQIYDYYVKSAAAFGMGVDCIGIERVIHWGPPSDTESYLQRTGRSGRNGELSYCIILFGKGMSRFVDKSMVEYCKNELKCRRDFLFQDFKCYNENRDRCIYCDLCVKKCIKCVNCEAMLTNLYIQ